MRQHDTGAVWGGECPKKLGGSPLRERDAHQTVQVCRFPQALVYPPSADAPCDLQPVQQRSVDHRGQDEDDGKHVEHGASIEGPTRGREYPLVPFGESFRRADAP